MQMIRFGDSAVLFAKRSLQGGQGGGGRLRSRKWDCGEKVVIEEAATARTVDLTREIPE